MNPDGRPRKFASPEEMQEVIDAYFQACSDNEIPPTVSGLAYCLDMTTESLRTYGLRDEFSATVKRAKQKVEISLEAGLYRGLNATGCIFSLKNNFGWKDQQDVHTTGDVNNNIVVRDINGNDIFAAYDTGSDTDD